MIPRKHKSGCYVIRVPLYEKLFFLALTSDAAEKLTGEGFSDGFVGTFQEFRDASPLMALRCTDPNTVAHEVVHAALWLMDECAVGVDYEHQEPMAYIVGHITEQVYAAIEHSSR